MKKSKSIAPFFMVSGIATSMFFVGPLLAGEKHSSAINASHETSSSEDVPIGTLEIVSEMEFSPGNVAVSEEGRIFSTIHPLRDSAVQLVEITENGVLVPFPNAEMQQGLEEQPSLDKFDTPLGLVFDNRNRLWMVDVGLGFNREARVFAYDIDTREELYRFDVPAEFVSEGSFVQDLVVDEPNGVVYLADTADPGIIIIDMDDGTFRRIVDLPSMASEDIDIVIDGVAQKFAGNPARISINPITLSEDRSTLYYGAMNGRSWYELPTEGILSGQSDEDIIASISRTGPKPVSDGAATDDRGYHYFTNIEDRSIDVLSPEGELATFKQDALFDWPDNVRIQGDWLYVAVNQIYKSPAFAGEEIGSPPFHILRLKFR